MRQENKASLAAATVLKETEWSQETTFTFAGKLSKYAFTASLKSFADSLMMSLDEYFMALN